MDWPRPAVVLWTGSKHSGKTSLATLLADRAGGDGFSVAGILAPAVYRDGILIGYDAIHIKTRLRMPLLRCVENKRAERERADVGSFAFSAEGLQLGNTALSLDSIRAADLVIVDEFGRFELRGQGWRSAVDRIAADFHGILLIVVRRKLVDDVCELYAGLHPERIAASEPYATDRIIQLLRLRRTSADG